jgi:hypothetical protein
LLARDLDQKLTDYCYCIGWGEIPAHDTKAMQPAGFSIALFYFQVNRTIENFGSIEAKDLITPDQPEVFLSLVEKEFAFDSRK